MPRVARELRAGYCYHVLNRGIGKAALFFNRFDYRAFLEMLSGMKAGYDIRLLAFCLMPNHFHLVVRPGRDDCLSDGMQWMLTSYAARFRAKYDSTGHVFQGRFKSFPIQADDHLLRVMRYVERNPVRANLAKSAADWRWSSCRRRTGSSHLIDESPVPLGRDWLAYVDSPQSSSELASLKRSVQRGTPFGSQEWRLEAADELGLGSTLRPRGRPPRINPYKKGSDPF